MEQNIQSDVADSPGAFYAQDYSLNKISFLTAAGQKIDLKKIFVEFSYFEDIYGFVSSGYVTVVDAQGFIELMQLTGNEFIEIDFGKVRGGKNSTDQIFRVYKSSGRKPSGNMNSEMYTLYFCSEELLLSEQTKISKSYKGKKVSDIIIDILKDKLKVSMKKIEVVEDTIGVYDFLIPTFKPLEAISWLSMYGRPKGGVGADMLFFQTKNGFNFRSIQTMMKDDVYATYKYQAKNLDDKTLDMQERATTVIDYEFGKPYDVLNEINSGTFANQLISIDPLTRTYNKTNFDYSKFKQEAASLNSGSVTNNMKNRLGKTQTESYEGVLKVFLGNSNQQKVPYIKEKEGGVAKDIFIETYVPNRTAQISLANYTTLKIAIPGDPGITAGRTINFNLMTLKPSNDNKNMDKLYSGKYLVTAVRHIIEPQGQYQTILELAKDSSPTTPQSINTSSADWNNEIQA